MNRRGSILIITLWILAILSLLAISFAHHTAVGIKLTEYHISSLKNLYICKAGIKRACYELNRDKEENTYDSLNNSWSNNQEAFKNAGVGDGAFTVNYQIEDDNKDMIIVYGMIDEERKININKLVKDGGGVDEVRLGQIKRLLEILDIDASIAGYIVDWLDTNDSPHGDGGAEEDFYQGLSVPYHCKNNLIECLDEMYLIRGVTAEIFKKLKPYITIYGDGKININTAEKEVFMSLGMDDTLAKQIIDYRSQDGGEEDLYSFKTLESIILVIPELKPFIDAGYLTVSSSVFTANVTSVLNNSKLAKRVNVVLEREEDNIKIKYWHES